MHPSTRHTHEPAGTRSGTQDEVQRAVQLAYALTDDRLTNDGDHNPVTVAATLCEALCMNFSRCELSEPTTTTWHTQRT